MHRLARRCSISAMLRYGGARHRNIAAPLSSSSSYITLGFQEPWRELLIREDFFVALPPVSFIEHFRALAPHLRVLYPRELDQSLLIHNCANSTWMRIKALTGEEVLEFAHELASFGVSGSPNHRRVTFAEPTYAVRSRRQRRRGSPLPNSNGPRCELQACSDLGSCESSAKRFAWRLHELWFTPQSQNGLLRGLVFAV